jgi:hypothetical protein
VSEPQRYPTAFVAYDEWNRRYGTIRYREWEAKNDCGKADKCVEMIPRPEVDRLVAEAVAAERERLTGVKDIVQQILMEAKQ